MAYYRTAPVAARTCTFYTIQSISSKQRSAIIGRGGRSSGPGVERVVVALLVGKRSLVIRALTSVVQ